MEKSVKKTCHECYGSGDGESSCCWDYMSCSGKNCKCVVCGKFVQWVPCELCVGSGSIVYEIGMKVRLWVPGNGGRFKDFTKKRKTFIKGKLVKLEPFVFRHRGKEVEVNQTDLEIF